MTWNFATSCGNETSKIRYLAWQYIRGRGVDAGCGQDLVHPDTIGVDKWRNGSFPVAKVAADAQDLSQFKDLDYVYSSHFLEHCVDYKKVLRNWWDTLKVGGYLILYLPHKNLYPNIGQFGANPDHKHDFVPQDIHTAMNEVANDTETGFMVWEDEDRALDNEYSFFQVFMKTHVAGERIYKPWAIRKPQKSCMIIRYGAFGDMVMMTSLLEPLIAQGYTIHLNTNKRGAQIVKHDSRVEHIIINDVEGPISGGFLNPYWEAFKKRYDKVIQLTATVEDSLLLTPMNPHLYNLPHTQRHMMCNHNYREWTHAVADVPMGAPPSIELSIDEIKAATEHVTPYVGKILALVVVRGSAHHKQYKHIAPFLFRLATLHNVQALLVADDEAANLCNAIIASVERFGAPEGFVKSIVGQNIRETIALAHLVDIVIGPETGVLNAVAYHPVIKMMFLSHSSVENLCKDWTNLLVQYPKDLPCYPCHRLHYNTQSCNLDEDGAAKCTTFEPKRLADEVMAAFHKIKEDQRKAKTDGKASV